jgi:hypothetical protein
MRSAKKRASEMCCDEAEEDKGRGRRREKINVSVSDGSSRGGHPTMRCVLHPLYHREGKGERTFQSLLTSLRFS